MQPREDNNMQTATASTTTVVVDDEATTAHKLRRVARSGAQAPIETTTSTPKTRRTDTDAFVDIVDIADIDDNIDNIDNAVDDETYQSNRLEQTRVSTTTSAVAVPTAATVPTPQQIRKEQLLVALAAVDETVDIAGLSALVDPRDTRITIAERCAAFANNFHAPLGALLTFVDTFLYQAPLDGDGRSRVLANHVETLPHFPHTDWLERGRLWASAVKTNAKAKRVHDLRRLEINFVFGVLNQLIADKGLHSWLLWGRDELKREGLRAKLKAALGSRHSEFLRAMRVAAQVALPLDQAFALHQAGDHWYSERHYRLLQAACTLNLVDDGVRRLVGTLENLPANPVDARKAGKVAGNALAAIEAELEAQREMLQLSESASHDRMNKRYEWIAAVLHRDAESLRPFLTPLFWIAAADGVKHLHFIDLSSALTPIKLENCESAGPRAFFPTADTCLFF